MDFNHCQSAYALLCLVAQSCPTLCNTMDCSPPGSSVHGYSPGKNPGAGCHALLPGDLPNPGIEPRSPALQTVNLPENPQSTILYIGLFFHLPQISILFDHLSLPWFICATSRTTGSQESVIIFRNICFFFKQSLKLKGNFLWQNFKY